MAARVTQEFFEVVILPTSSARVTQEFVEVVILPTSGVRATQEFVEVVIQNNVAGVKRNQAFFIGED